MKYTWRALLHENEIFFNMFIISMFHELKEVKKRFQEPYNVIKYSKKL